MSMIKIQIQAGNFRIAPKIFNFKFTGKKTTKAATINIIITSGLENQNPWKSTQLILKQIARMES